MPLWRCFEGPYAIHDVLYMTQKEPAFGTRGLCIRDGRGLLMVIVESPELYWKDSVESTASSKLLTKHELVLRLHDLDRTLRNLFFEP